MERTTTRTHLIGTAERRALVRDLATYTSKSDRAELAAMLSRYDSDGVQIIRDIVDETRSHMA